MMFVKSKGGLKWNRDYISFEEQLNDKFQYHSDSGSALIHRYGSVVTQFYFRNGLLHREDGAAIEDNLGNRIYARNGRLYKSPNGDDTIIEKGTISIIKWMLTLGIKEIGCLTVDPCYQDDNYHLKTQLRRKIKDIDAICLFAANELYNSIYHPEDAEDEDIYHDSNPKDNDNLY